MTAALFEVCVYGLLNGCLYIMLACLMHASLPVFVVYQV